jgi:hypothetical protein
LTIGHFFAVFLALEAPVWVPHLEGHHSDFPACSLLSQSLWLYIFVISRAELDITHFFHVLLRGHKGIDSRMHFMK